MIIIGLLEIDVNRSGAKQKPTVQVPARTPHHLAVEYPASGSVHFGETAIFQAEEAS